MLSHTQLIDMFSLGLSIMVFHTRGNMIFKNSIHNVADLQVALIASSGARVIK